ncbi:hypothetical protein NUW54_g14489 [Trametes sanguinea]|uniref:Uncharacterized protein n=1 Tax=Trametes sanguinea TaxID=158606 RepID=A0ACC1MCD9_9APHY|nr:hypothetical protein NUW54_g14489 [Trametes sanguinea]
MACSSWLRSGPNALVAFYNVDAHPTSLPTLGFSDRTGDANVPDGEADRSSKELELHRDRGFSSTSSRALTSRFHGQQGPVGITHRELLRLALEASVTAVAFIFSPRAASKGGTWDLGPVYVVSLPEFFASTLCTEAQELRVQPFAITADITAVGAYHRMSRRRSGEAQCSTMPRPVKPKYTSPPSPSQIHLSVTSGPDRQFEGLPLGRCLGTVLYAVVALR